MEAEGFGFVVVLEQASVEQVASKDRALLGYLAPLFGDAFGRVLA